MRHTGKHKERRRCIANFLALGPQKLKDIYAYVQENGFTVSYSQVHQDLVHVADNVGYGVYATAAPFHAYKPEKSDAFVCSDWPEEKRDVRIGADPEHEPDVDSPLPDGH